MMMPDFDQLMPHALCLLVSPELIAILVLSDIAVALAYFIIPLVMALVMRRNPAPMPTLLWLYAIFILLCGGTHALAVVTMFFGGGWYWVQAIELVVTAFVSLTTAAILARESKAIARWLQRYPSGPPK